MNQNINRSISPEIQTINPDLFGIDGLMPEMNRFANNIPYYQINKGSQEVVKIDFIFEAGTAYQDVLFSAFAALQLITEGTEKFTAAQIAEVFDFYGASIEKEIERDFTTISIYCLNKYLENILPYVEEIIKSPVFPENEISIFKEKQKTLLAINKQKVSYVARTKFLSQLFGQHHPYGQVAEEEDINNIERKHLLEFYEKNMNSVNCRILISGRLNDNLIQQIEKYFGSNIWGNPSKRDEKDFKVNVSEISRNFIVKEDAVQSAIRVGRGIFSIEDKDYHQLKFLNTLLGGYFGSRLMKNIREDKGYTYGINSGILRLKHASFFVITTEVGCKYTQQTTDEIYKEIQRLRDDYVSEEEINLVRNFKMGAFLRSIDGAFATANYVKNLLQLGLCSDDIKQNVNIIQNITAEEIKIIANKYLQYNNLHEMVVGRK